MSSLELNHVYKVYPNGAKAVNDFSMSISDKEFIVFVGPSGCGKSTTLRMIAGLEEISVGDIKIDNVIVNDAEPKERDIAMVFQNYALYPHMTVYKNMAFGLKLRHMPKEIIDKKVKDAAEILGISEYLNRKPAAMSGGQRQRVALGRAIVREPKVFLLDEPLSNLDAKLRATMRTEICKLHNKLQTTFIYVTHDQVEAMTMGTRIVVMKDGFVQQIDSPKNLYRYPNNQFVAGFIGTPQMNFFDVTLKDNGDVVEINFENCDLKINAKKELFLNVDKSYLTGDKKVVLGLRCEHVSLDSKLYEYKTKVKVTSVEELGVDSLVYGNINLNNEEEIIDNSTKITIKTQSDPNVNYNDVVDISLNLTAMHLFDKETEITINPRLPNLVKSIVNVKNSTMSMFGKSIKLPSAIALNDGDYNFEIPINGIKEGKTFKFNVYKINKYSDFTVYILKNNDDYIFLKDDESKYNVGDEVGLDFDLKMAKFANENQTISELNTTNSIDFSVKKTLQKVKHNTADGKEKLVNEYFCSIVHNDYVLDLNKNLGFKLINLKTNKIFKDTIDVHFTPYDVSFSETGLPCVVKEILDYGNEKFALVCVEDKYFINVFIKDEVSLGENHITINANNIEAFDDKRGIKLA